MTDSQDVVAANARTNRWIRALSLIVALFFVVMVTLGFVAVVSIVGSQRHSLNCVAHIVFRERPPKCEDVRRRIQELNPNVPFPPAPASTTTTSTTALVP